MSNRIKGKGIIAESKRPLGRAGYLSREGVKRVETVILLFLIIFLIHFRSQRSMIRHNTTNPAERADIQTTCWLQTVALSVSFT